MSREAWAVWNACNGVFEVTMRREEAVKKLAEYPEAAGCEVVPVLIEVEPRDRWLLREWHERNEHPPESSEGAS